jgi:nitroreductase
LDMPDALELLTTRRSFKAVELVGPAPSEAEIDTLLTVASRVPDHGKLAPWRFIVFEGEARRAAGEAIASAFRAKYPDAKPEHIAAERERLTRAPLVIAVVSRAAPHVKIPEWEQVLSAGAAAMNLVTAAHALGYGANWITEWYAYDRGVLDALGLAQHERIAGFIHIGRPPGHRRIGRGRRSMRSQSALPLSCPEADRSLQGERRVRVIRWVSSMSARGEINFYSES